MLSTHELADFLRACPDVPVIVQKDAEGNDYSPASDAEPGYYWAYNTYSGQVQADPSDRTVRCVVIKPIN